MSRWSFALVSVLLFVALAGCGGLAADDAAEADRAETLQSETVERMEDVETYSFEGETTSVAGETRFEVDVEGTFDLPAQRARMNTTTRSEGPRGSAEQSVETYIINDTVYVSPAGEDRWQTVDAGELPGVAEDPWSEHGLEVQRQLLAEANVSVAGNETIDGRETTVLAVEPGEEALDEYLQSVVGEGLGDPEIEDVELTHWVTDDGHLLRVEAEMNVSVGGETAEVTTTARYDDFDDDVDIEVPEGARGERARY